MNKDIEDNIVRIKTVISGYYLFHVGFPIHRGASVCIYLTESLCANHHTYIENDNFECLWLWLHPHRLPRPLYRIALYECNIIHLVFLRMIINLWKNIRLAQLICCTTHTSNSGIILVFADFRDLEISLLLATHNLKQVVKEIVDLIITNLSSYFSTPTIFCDGFLPQILFTTPLKPNLPSIQYASFLNEL